MILYSSIRLSFFALTAVCIGLATLTCTHSVAGELRGLITDRATGEPIAGVVASLEGTRLGAITDTLGKFRINNVPRGTFTLRAVRIGYQPTHITVTTKVYTEDVVFTMLQSPVVKQDIIVSANRRIQAVQDVPISVSTLSQEDLSQRNITSLDDALRYVSGVNVVKDQVNIRGSSGFALGVGNRTMVLLDGFPLMSGDNGDIKFDVLPVADVERIEVIKGAGSALYGTGALGGVVSLFTKPVSENGATSVRGYVGAYTQPRFPEWKYRSSLPINSGLDVRVARKIGAVTLSASGGIRSDQSYRDFDASTRGFLYGKAQWHPTDAHQITLFGLYALQVSENFLYWQDLTHATQPPTSQDRDQMLHSGKLATAVEWQWLVNNRTSLVLRPGLFRTHYENTRHGITQDSNTSTALAWNVDALLTSTVTNDLTITAGATGRVNTVTSDVYGNQVQTIGSLFTQAEYSLTMGPVFTAGIRIDHEQTATLQSQLEFSPKLGMSWTLAESLTIRASTGRGFRAPTIAERYANIRYGPFNVKPNPSLLSESSWSFEIGSRWTTTALTIPIDIDLAVFDNELYNLIEPRFDVNDPSVPIVFRNITRARIIGSELTLRAALHSSLIVESGVTGMLPRDLVLQQTLKYRNNVLWYSRVLFTPIEPLSVQMEYRFQNRVENIDNNLEVFIPDAGQRIPSHVIDARVFWKLPIENQSYLRLGIVGKNLLDYYYTEAVANLSPTRNIVFQAEYSR